MLFSFNVCVKAIFFCLAFRHGVSVQAMESFYTLESGLLKAIMVGERQGLGARNRDQLLDTNWAIYDFTDAHAGRQAKCETIKGGGSG